MAGLAILAGFCACYVIAIPWAIDYPKSQRLRWLLVVLIVLCGAEVPFARADSFVMGVFVVVPAIAALGNRSWPIVAAAIAAPLIVPPAVASWHTGPAVETTASSALTALALYAFFQVLGANRALSQAQREIARLAAENERARISRDLHDLLGHSLTTITVKAGLARRLGGSDPGRAQQEIAEVEDLARRALQEVRSAVSGDHTMTLGTELAKAREILSAAGISAELPRASDLVDAGHQELFAWVVREGVTNVVRHAHATTCSVHLAPGAIEIVDDGTGGEVTEGSGLRGLRARVEAAGGRLDASRCPKGGWRLQVTVPLPAREAT
jgi:two-component system sensor histidine kinase DesK